MIRTTNLILNLEPDNFTTLNRKYKLVQYQIPRNFNFRDKKHLRTHNEYKDKIDKPYYFNSHEPAIYVLYAKDEVIQPIYFEYLSEEVEGKTVLFRTTKWHIILKVLLSLFFYNKDKNYRICQNKIFLTGRIWKQFSTCVHVDLKEYYSTLNRVKTHKEFYIVPRLVRFVKSNSKDIDETYIHLNQYYEKVTTSFGIYFRQIKPSHVLEFSKKYELWQLAKTSKKRRAKLNWHSNSTNWKEAEGYLIWNFQKMFSNFLQKEVGVHLLPKTRNSVLFKSMNSNTRIDSNTHKIEGYTVNGLPIHLLKTICVFDNRLKKSSNTINTLPISEFIRVLNEYSIEHRLNIDFQEISEEFLEKKKPTLVLQDYSQKDFLFDREEKPIGILASNGFTDPYKRFYRQYSDVIKQSINVNPNDSDNFIEENYAQYLDYGIEEFQVAKNKINVCLNELFLKNKIFNQNSLDDIINIETIAPLWEYGYIFNNTLMYFEEKIAKFIDFSSLEGKKERTELLTKFGLVWYRDIESIYKRKYYKNDNIEKTRFIIGRNLVIEIEEGNYNKNERIIYNYEAISKVKKDQPKKSAKKNEHILGQKGIWFDETDRAYSVGDYQALNQSQPKAHLVRKFSVYKGEKYFDHNIFLESMAVQFVRNKQYTVYPFFFDLVRLYSEK